MKSIKGLVGILAAMSTLVLSGCTSLSEITPSVIQQRRDQVLIKGMISTEEINRGKPLSRFNELHEYALLSAQIYEEGREKKPKQLARDQVIRKSGWKRRADLEPTPPQPRWSWKVGDLRYQVWEKSQTNGQVLVAVVFRGTDWYQLGDWFANLRWGTRFIPFSWDQYDQTRSLIPELIPDILEAYKGKTVTIISTGHSLGGGLAQQALYCTPIIADAYTFDPSSVTGYSSVKRELRNESRKGTRIYRIYEDREILVLLRELVKQVWPISHSDPSIIEMRYNVMRGGMLTNHSMPMLADGLNDLAHETAEQKEER